MFFPKTVFIVAAYLVITSLYGIWLSKSMKGSGGYTKAKLTKWQAAAFLAGFTLGGAATYGFAGDTVQFGYTYLFWFPFSVLIGWVATALLFAKPYHRLGGLTVPSYLKQRFGKKTQLASSISMLFYAFFIVILEIYALAAVIQSLFPSINPTSAYILSLVVNCSSVAFSGLTGSSKTNLIHSATMFFAFIFSVFVLWNRVGGWNQAVVNVLSMQPAIIDPGINGVLWASIKGMGIGTIGQLMLGKIGRLGGVSTISNIAASCETEDDAQFAFLFGGIISVVPIFFAGLLGVLSAAQMGSGLEGMPIYISLGISLQEVSPILAGLLLAAVSAAIISSFGPLSLVFSTVLVEDILGRKKVLKEKTKRLLHPLMIVLVCILAIFYLRAYSMSNLLPFLYETAFPCTVPITLVTLFGLYSKKISKEASFWAIIISLPSSLAWTFILKNPLNIPSLMIAYLIPLFILITDHFRKKPKEIIILKQA
jgi:solute:Na+ symporter, SSS family